MSRFKCVVHGSFSKHFDAIQAACAAFRAAGIEVLAPKLGELVDSRDGFELFADEIDQDPRLVELLYLQNLKRLGDNGFSYFVNPGGYLGKSAAYELGIAQLTATPCFFMSKLDDHPAYLPQGTVLSPQTLADYIVTNQRLPVPRVRSGEREIHKLWREITAPGSVVATGAMIEYQPRSSRRAKEILLVKTHKWGNRYSIVGDRVRPGERLQQALIREVRQETGLRGQVGSHLCTFDQLRGSGYYQPVQHLFVDTIVQVKSRRVRLNDEAQEYVWALPAEALQQLDIEPNARTTIQKYLERTAARG